MADSLKDLLDRRDLEEPAEIGALRNFLRQKYQVSGKIAIRDNRVIIAVPSAALAGTLRMRLPELEKLAQTKRKLVIRIG